MWMRLKTFAKRSWRKNINLNLTSSLDPRPNRNLVDGLCAWKQRRNWRCLKIIFMSQKVSVDPFGKWRSPIGRSKFEITNYMTPLIVSNRRLIFGITCWQNRRLNVSSFFNELTSNWTIYYRTLSDIEICQNWCIIEWIAKSRNKFDLGPQARGGFD